MELPNKKYQIIYADPPWKYKEDWGNGSFKHSYLAMDTEEIKKLSVQDICDDVIEQMHDELKVRLIIWSEEE